MYAYTPMTMITESSASPAVEKDMIPLCARGTIQAIFLTNAAFVSVSVIILVIVLVVVWSVKTLPKIFQRFKSNSESCPLVEIVQNNAQEMIDVS